jgi:hypothetical protein
VVSTRDETLDGQRGVRWGGEQECKARSSKDLPCFKWTPYLGRRRVSTNTKSNRQGQPEGKNTHQKA